MNIFDKVQEIFNQYDLKPIELPKDYKNVYAFLRDYPEFGKNFKSKIEDCDLNEKYKLRIPTGWYGFDIGTPVIPAWMEIIDKIVAICVEADPYFEIHQIKMKYGEICFYVHSIIIDDIDDIESLIMSKMWDRALIY
jgi:hypothetical protein